MKHIGIVGVGGFAATVLRGILATEQEGLSHLDAAVIRNPAKYADTLEKLRQQGRTIYMSVPEMLEKERGRIDIVALPVGIPYHSELAIQALEAGYDVLLEKPVAATVQEVDAIIAAEKRSGHFVAIGYQHIQTPAIQALRQAIESGKLGHIKQAKCYAIWPRPLSYYTRNHWAGQIKVNGRWVLDGPVTNALAHFLHNMFYLVDIECGGQAAIESVQAELYRGKDIPTYDTVCLRAHMSSGAEVQIALSHSVGVNENPVIEIEAENATVNWSQDDTKSVTRFRDGTIMTVESPTWTEFNKECVRDAIYVAEGRRARPLSTPQNSRNQVLAVDLAFESSEGVWDIPASFRETVIVGKNDPLAKVVGMEEVIRRTFTEFKMPSELGAPWAHPAKTVSAEGYREFPRSKALGEKLDKLAK
jgi:predicted dehydrogenase